MRRRYEMDVVAHEAIRPNGKSESFAVSTQQIEIESSVVEFIEDGLTAIAALGDVMWNTFNDSPRYS